MGAHHAAKDKILCLGVVSNLRGTSDSLSFLKHPVAQDTARTKSRFSRVMDTGTGSEFLMEFLCASKFENLVFQQFSTFHIYSQCTAQCVSQRQTIYTGVVL